MSHAIRFLVARIGASSFAFPADWVRGIITLTEGGSAETVTWARMTYERTDLAARLTRTTLTPGIESRIILYGHGDQARAFLVDQVVGLVDVARHEIRPLPPQFRGGERERLIGLFVEPDYIALITNPYWILDLPANQDILGALALQGASTRSAQSTKLLPVTPADQNAALTGAGRGE